MTEPVRALNSDTRKPGRQGRLIPVR